MRHKLEEGVLQCGALGNPVHDVLEGEPSHFTSSVPMYVAYKLTGEYLAYSQRAETRVCFPHVPNPHLDASL